MRGPAEDADRHGRSRTCQRRDAIFLDSPEPAAAYTLMPLAPGNPCTNDTWYPLERIATSARMDAVSVWTGSEMLVWGGSSNTDSGGRYCASCAVLDGFEAAKNLSFSSNTTLAWSANAGVTAYALYRGTFDGSAPLTNHTCFQGGLATPTGSDPAVPAAGTGFYYLVGASNGCSRTSLGTMTGGALRANPACP